jgi:hypothetical protein
MRKYTTRGWPQPSGSRRARAPTRMLRHGFSPWGPRVVTRPSCCHRRGPAAAALLVAGAPGCSLGTGLPPPAKDYFLDEAGRT